MHASAFASSLGMMRAAAVLVSFLITGAPGSADVDRRILDAAAEARASGDEDRVRGLLRAWASMSERTTAPPGFESEGVRAIAEIARSGLLRVYASRLPDRIRVGLRDPAKMVDRIVVTLRDGLTKRQLPRLLAHAAGRLEYGADEPIPPTAEIEVEVFYTGLGDDILVRRTVISPELGGALPPVPSPEVMPEAPPQGSADGSAGRGLTWWWVGGAIVAAALAGAAVWQESRFQGPAQK